MKTKRKTPDIRFRGFSDDWEQRKLGEIVEVNSGRDYKHLSSGEIPVFGTGGYMLSVDQSLSENQDAVGIGRKGTIDKPFILKSPFWTVDTLFYCIPSKNDSIEFVSNIFRNINWKRFDESTGVPSLSKATINSIIVTTPKIDEQKVIGKLFSNLEITITLHQCKLQQLKEVKRGMLLKMFCKRKSEIPELRFLDFKEQWSCAKLENLSTITTGKLNANAATENGLYRFYTTSKEFFHTDSYSFDGDAILINGNGDLGFTRMYSGKFDAYQRTYVLMDFKEEYVFLYYSIINELPKKIHAEAIGGAMPYIKLETISDLRLKIPIKSEQIEIGLFLGKLDRLIELQEREIELLEETKKGFLQKMFV